MNGRDDEPGTVFGLITSQDENEDDERTMNKEESRNGDENKYERKIRTKRT